MTPTEDLYATEVGPPTDECRPEQTPLDCEIELIRPLLGADHERHQ